MKIPKRFFNPIVLPVYFFAAVIIIGALLLYSPLAKNPLHHDKISFIDALFVATSSACVTGLSTIDVATAFNRFGHTVMMALIQIGGLGIMTFSSLFFYMLRHKTRLSDMLAVGQNMRSDQSFSLGRFLIGLFAMVFTLELIGAAFLHFGRPGDFNLFEAAFHSVSAFCNAGFALFTDNFIGFQTSPLVNVTIMVLIILGGLGFSVLLELFERARSILAGRKHRRLTWGSGVVLGTTAALILGGAFFIALGTWPDREFTLINRVWVSLFQSVTARTAGFCTIDLANLSDFSLMVICFLMFIGGSPASTAGGIKTTTIRVMLAHGLSLVRGGSQAVVAGRAIDERTRRSALTLFLTFWAIIFMATTILCLSEGGLEPHNQSPGPFLDIVFEVISALSTTGLSVGLTPRLTVFGKSVIIFLMFIGRVGLLIFLAAIYEMWQPKRYLLPEESLMIG